MGKITCSLLGNQICFDVPEAHSLRALEDALRKRGVEAHVDRGRRKISVPAVSVSALGDVVMAPNVAAQESVVEELAKYGRSEHGLSKQRAVLAALMQPGEARKLLEGFAEVTKLDAHQVEAVAAASHPDIPGLCMFDEQGLGKTVQALFAFHRLRQQGRIEPPRVFRRLSGLSHAGTADSVAAR